MGRGNHLDKYFFFLFINFSLFILLNFFIVRKFHVFIKHDVTVKFIQVGLFIGFCVLILLVDYYI